MSLCATAFRATLLLLFSGTVGCSTPRSELEPLYKGKLTYPITELELSAGLILRHVAGKPLPPDSDSELILGSDAERTESVYQLIGGDGEILFTGPSSLSDPKFVEEELTDYHIKNDRLAVYASKSGSTILIMENRSPTYPTMAYVVLHSDDLKNWNWALAPVKLCPLDGPFDISKSYYPHPAFLDDREIEFECENGKQRFLIEELRQILDQS